jgi:hypothetical protein
MADTTVYGLTVTFYSDLVTLSGPCGFKSSLPYDPVIIHFNYDDVKTRYIFPEMYSSNPPGELVFTKLPAFMNYSLSTEITGNGVTVIRALDVDKCGPITAGDFPVWFDLKCGGDAPPDSSEIIFSIEGKDAEQCPQFMLKLPTETCVNTTNENATDTNTTALNSTSSAKISAKPGGCWKVIM